MATPSLPSSPVRRRLLVLGDAACLAAITIYGFAVHQEAEAVASSRFLATYLPLLGAWLLAAGGLGALDPARASAARQLWRPAAAALVAPPVAAVMRSLWLGTTPVPVFIAVLTGVTFLGIGLWRGALFLLLRRRID